MKIVAVSDVHYSAIEIPSMRRGHLGDILLRRVVERVNRWIKPDVVVLLGDLINNPDCSEAASLMTRLRSITDQLKCPAIILPGNHDCSVQEFYQFFPDPVSSIDAAGTRFLIYHDQEEPGYNARRSAEDLDRMSAAQNYDGPAVTLQHCSLFPPNTSDCPYNYTNVYEVIDRMKRYGIKLAISGHYHAGVDHIHTDDADFVIVPGLCDSPFAFLEIELDEQGVKVNRHSLYQPELADVKSRISA